LRKKEKKKMSDANTYFSLLLFTRDPKSRHHQLYEQLQGGMPSPNKNNLT
jgi:hypothetical protein